MDRYVSKRLRHGKRASSAVLRDLAVCRCVGVGVRVASAVVLLSNHIGCYFVYVLA